MSTLTSSADSRQVEPLSMRPQPSLASKVPAVTLWFWVIKVLCTTVGETASDFLAVDLGWGLTGTSVAAGLALAGVLLLQLRLRRYQAIVYWSTVVLVSVFGTLLTDDLTDNLGIPLEWSTAAFSLALIATFAAWFWAEGTLSIQSIVTRKRELFYWLAILFTFALGTAVGDLAAESLGLGYLVTGIYVCVAIAVIAVAARLGLDSVLAFWFAYILTRPLGASLGDYLSQSTANGGLALGATVTSVIFLGAIAAVVAYMVVSKCDQVAAPVLDAPSTAAPSAGPHRAAIGQTIAVCCIVAVLGVAGYSWRRSQLSAQAALAAASSPDAPLGDLSAFRTIAQDCLTLVQAGDLGLARDRIGDLEYTWDTAEGRLRAMDLNGWTVVDDAIDDALSRLRARQPDPATCTGSLNALLAVIDNLDAPAPQN